MPRPRNKEDLLKAANENFEKLFAMIDQMSETERNTPFDFSKDEKKKAVASETTERAVEK